MEKFEKDTLRGMLVKGNLRAAMAYWEQFPETAALYEKGVALFQKEHYLTYDADAELNGILLVYQKYYRDVFYLELSAGRPPGGCGNGWQNCSRLRPISRWTNWRKWPGTRSARSRSTP